MKAYFVLLIALLVMVVLPWLISAANAMQSVGSAL